ncbi:MAG: amino acid ABC transporter permease [Caldilineaceae bacterium]|nr:amino acid ABC transporter permease [Caldilineaceae bacterium]
MSAQPAPQIPSDNRSRIIGPFDRMAQWPWWLLLAVMIAAYIIFLIITDEQMQKTFWFISGQTPTALWGGQILFKGMAVTLTVSITAYSMALLIGMTLGLMRSSTNPFFYNFSSFYVEIVRGIPMLVLLLYVAFALTPIFVNLLNSIGIPIQTRDVPGYVRAIIALAIGYGAFSAEIFRAGIQSIERGQYEAARALGMNYFQIMSRVILPQAIRRVLPALGNDFIAMVKDSSLVAILGVQDMTQLTRLYYSGNFLYMQSLTMLAFMYLIMVVMLTRFVRWMEHRLQRGSR